MATPHTAADNDVYEPCEDSFLFLDVLEKESFSGKVVLEIGSGSGVVSTFLHSIHPKAVYLATDINPKACEISRKTWSLNNASGDLEMLNASLSPLRPHLVDVLLFNPPYVPSENVPDIPDTRDCDQWIYMALDGGEDGMEVTNIVLDQLDSILATQGIAYILFCARNHPDKVKLQMESRGWAVEVCMKRKAGWEVLSILKFSRG